ncbi:MULTISPECIES: ABC transporter ATP-binding protein [unclassified Oceanispirochaeta]|uniref:ABC transporter ATP-binding protein n=1 Tax=unclassified Oceanispirochaeta TaxID=2635722 RepID=UPI000E097277|nr:MULTISPECIES: ABC transporter ATP-binding protein [unclassified Oceanispirochaeta]MBF9015310.1 ABC transporter ATP-binding protein [Oceanispirochaeta sp. M2]NPD71768.1 ABC transporter ATP-binding protein [Oceanispirochaeta sp. M1]RDG32958.1 ABC transporter ATP-binding protein [Oceanispirochaeta sp. M1]
MIQCDNISKWYGEQKALDSLTMTIPEGETSILLGPSGCGKSTTLRLINKLIIPEEGNISIDGKNIRDIRSVDLRRSMGYVIQSIALLPHMTVEENISLVPTLLKWDEKRKESRCLELLDMIGLNAELYRKKYPSQLSGGEAQRIAVARALAADPPFLLMDEPFGAVDPLNRESLQNEFIEIQRKLKKTVVFVTHDLEEAVRLGDKIFVLKEGVLQQNGSPAEILGQPSNDFVRDFVGPDRSLKLLNYYLAGNFMQPIPIESAGAWQNAPVLDTGDNLKTALSIMLEMSIDNIFVENRKNGEKGILARQTIEELSNLHRKSGEKSE